MAELSCCKFWYSLGGDNFYYVCAMCVVNEECVVGSVVKPRVIHVFYYDRTVGAE
ncbi:MAG: hypothetical protein QXX51_07525 [Candidatus Bathyarchaeia archaeon]